MIKTEVNGATADIEIDLEKSGPYQKEYAVLVVATTNQVASMLKVDPVELLESVVDLVREMAQEGTQA